MSDRPPGLLGQTVCEPIFVGQVANLRPIGNRPAPGAANDAPPPPVVFRPCRRPTCAGANFNAEPRRDRGKRGVAWSIKLRVASASPLLRVEDHPIHELRPSRLPATSQGIPR